MNATFIRSHLSALALAATLILAACGGGDASPPAESAPPTVNITSSVVSGAAAGPVTFTFTFSEDVGSSFTADTLVVTNGTKGAFTKVSPTQYTLVVTPAPNSVGSIGLSVSADAVADLVGNKIPLPVIQAQSFDTRPPTVTITDDAAGTATGAVTFTFNFSKDVGTSFTADDVVVTGGATKGAFARVSGTQFTLVVTPPANASGTITVSVAAGSFSDIAGNASLAVASTSKEFLAPQTITFASPGSQAIGTLPPVLVATASSGLPVAISSTTPGVCTVSGTSLTLVAAGTCSLSASQAGNATFAPATPVVHSFSVTGGGGAPVADLVFSTGLSAGNRTIEGGEVGGFSGSNLDGFNCSPPATCGSGGGFAPAVAAADSFFFYFYQTPSPATDLYMGIFVLAPGVVGGLNASGDTAGVQVNGQTAIKFKVGQNAEWFGTATNKFAVNLELGKRYVVGGNTCRIQLRSIVTPTAAAATEYTVPFSAFSVVQDCGQGLSVAQALAASPISQVAFQGGAGSAAQSAGGQSTGANLSVQTGGVYPSTLVVVGGIRFE